jgi:multidrug efflux pump subunit AcrA (membrane-fusion protein)
LTNSSSSAYAKPRRRSLVLAIIGALVLFSLLLLPRIYAHFRAASAPSAESQLTARVEQKKFSQVFRLSGTTQATRSFIVSAPQLEGAQLNNLNITAIVPAGATVKQGEILVQFDPQAQVKDFLDKQKTYTDLVSQVEQKRPKEKSPRERTTPRWLRQKTP